MINMTKIPKGTKPSLVGRADKKIDSETGKEFFVISLWSVNEEAKQEAD
jgi:hypothetical protein